jgi:hypothetical protein
MIPDCTRSRSRQCAPIGTKTLEGAADGQLTRTPPQPSAHRSLTQGGGWTPQQAVHVSGRSGHQASGSEDPCHRG